MKTCPYCAEQIQDAAILCRFCGKSLPPSENKVTNAAKKVTLEEAAAFVDRAIVRAKPGNAFGDSIGKTKVDVFIAPGLADDTRVVATTSALVVGQVGLAVINLLGQGTVSAVLAAASAPTLSSVATFWDAFALTFPMSLSTSIWMYFVRAGRLVGGQAAVGAVVIAALIFGPAMAKVMGGRPLYFSPNGLATLLQALFDYYGPIPFFGGLLAGGIAGFVSHEWLPFDTTRQ